MKLANAYAGIFMQLCTILTHASIMIERLKLKQLAIEPLQGEKCCMRDCKNIRGFLRVTNVWYRKVQNQQGQVLPNSLPSRVNASLAQ